MATSQRKRILVTGGTGYIGSHTVVLLVEAGWDVTIIDNLANSSEICLDRISAITKKPEAVKFENCDLRDYNAIDKVFKEASAVSTPAFHMTIHFAAMKAVGESRQIPLTYYDNNISGSVNLLRVMDAYNCKRIIFSSSCTVYGSVAKSPLSEDSPVGEGLTNAYATTKFMMETILRDLYSCYPEWTIIILRYFNPVGAHPSGLIGEDPRGVPNCILPYLLQVLVGRREKLTVYGSDYPTRDGTCIRDYIHVMDVAQGHIDALNWVDKVRAERPSDSKQGMLDVFNFGTGNGTTVFELIHAMEKAAGRPIPHVVGARRDGDLDAAYANPVKAANVLGWHCKNSIEQICTDAWNWQSKNPSGYETREKLK
jgi:UDP-glucose 4-epimerase